MLIDILVAIVLVIALFIGYARGVIQPLMAEIFFFGTLLLWPLLTIANRPMLIAGVPVLALYLFTVWAVIVAVLVAVALRGRSLEDDE